VTAAVAMPVLTGAPQGVRMGTLRAMFLEYVAPQLHEITVRPQRPCDIVGLNWATTTDHIYVHKITAVMHVDPGVPVVTPIASFDPPRLAASAAASLPVDIHLRAGDEITLHVEYDGNESSVDARGAWVTDETLGIESNTAQRGRAMVHRRGSIRWFGNRITPSARYGKQATIVVDDSVIYATERRAGELLYISESSLETVDHRAHAAIETVAAERGWPRPIAIRQHTTPASQIGDATTGYKPFVSIVSGYDDVRGWMFAIGWNGTRSVIDIFPDGSNDAPQWLDDWARMTAGSSSRD
jgi:hypothetical protein